MDAQQAAQQAAALQRIAKRTGQWMLFRLATDITEHGPTLTDPSVEQIRGSMLRLAEADIAVDPDGRIIKNRFDVVP